MNQATIEIHPTIDRNGHAVRFLLTGAGDPAAVSAMLLEACRRSAHPALLSRGLLALGLPELCAGIARVSDYAELTSYHYQLWAPMEGCALMVLVRAVRDEKGRREWYVRSGPMSLESFLLAHQELQPGDLPLWGVKDSLMKEAA